MPFTAITSDEIQIGRPVKQSIFNKVKENFDELNSRTELSGAVAINEIITGFIPNGETIDIRKISGAVTFTTCELNIVSVFNNDAEDTDFIEIDVLTSATLAGTQTSIFSTTPRIVARTGQTQRAPAFSNATVASGSYIFIRVVSWYAAVKSIHLLLR